MASSALYKRRLRKALYARQGGLCYWCQIQMEMSPDGTIPVRSRHSATFDHLHPRGHPQRLIEQSRRWCEMVLACHLCNQQRDHAFRQKLTKEQRMALSMPRRVRQVPTRWEEDTSLRLALLNLQPTPGSQSPPEQREK